MTTNTLAKLIRRRARVRATVSGTPTRPRLSVKISLSHIIAQVIDDSKGQTLAYVTTVGQKDVKGSMTDKAVWVGEQIAKAAGAKKVKQVVFDRIYTNYKNKLAKNV